MEIFHRFSTKLLQFLHNLKFVPKNNYSALYCIVCVCECLFVYILLSLQLCVVNGNEIGFIALLTCCTFLVLICVFGVVLAFNSFSLTLSCLKLLFFVLCVCVSVFRVLGLHQQNYIIHLLVFSESLNSCLVNWKFPEFNTQKKRETSFDCTKYMNDGI